MKPNFSNVRHGGPGTSWSFTVIAKVFLALISVPILVIRLRGINRTLDGVVTTESFTSFTEPSIAKSEKDMPLRNGYFDKQRAQQIANSDVVTIPFDPYNLCTGKVPQATCLRTLSLLNKKESPVPIAFDLVDRVCKDVPEGADSVSFPLCLQYGDTNGILVMRANHDPKGFQHLFPSDANYVFPPHADVSIIDRKIVAMHGYYEPKSETADNFRSQDDNTGNSIWQYGATNMFNPVTTLFEGTFTKHADAVVIAAANVLNMEHEGMVDYELQNFWDIVSRYRAPALIMGLGMQANFEQAGEVENMTLFSFQRQVVGEIEQWQSVPAIGVRGNITANLCRNSGITHCVPIGCPSLTISHDLNLGATLQTNWNAVLERCENNEKLTIGIVLPAIEPEELDERAEQRDLLLNAIGQNCLVHNCVFLLQQPFDELNAYRLNALVIKRNQTDLQLKKFNNVEDWVAFVKDSVDFVISTRIHGAMACMASGTPTVVIPTDFRIMELVDAMSVPHLTIADVKKEKLGDVRTVMKNARFSTFNEFEDNRREKIAQWRSIMQSVGLEMNPALLNIIDPTNS